MDEAVVRYVLNRLHAEPLPDETAVQLAFQLGWLEALQAVEEALDLRAVPADARRPGAIQEPPGPK